MLDSPSLLAYVIVQADAQSKCLASIRHLHRLSKTICMDTGLAGNTHSFMVTRMKQISELERYVVLLIDEIYAAQRVTRASQQRPLYSYRPGVHLLYQYSELLPDTGCSRVTAASSGLRLQQPQGDVCDHGENPHGRQQALQRNPPCHCRQDHSSDTIFYQISKKIFNMMTRN